MTLMHAISVPTGVRFARKSLFFSIVFVLIFFTAFAAAQVVITPNVAAYPFQVLPGSTRQINVQITGGTLNTVNWSVLSTTGGASATFTTPAANGASTVSAGLATVQVNIGSTAGNCTIPEAQKAIGTYTITSPATVTVQAQSVDNPSQTANFLFNVCAKTTKVMVAPAYQQAYKGQHRMLQSWVMGDTDETGTWSIIAQPTGGNATLADTTYRDADFVATITGRYTLQYTSNSNASESATAIVYVSPDAMPTYAFTSTPNQTEPRECYPDPALTGGHYEVGLGKAYTTISSVPAITSWTPGTIMRIWNTDNTGSNPSTYYEYFQVKNTGTPTQPVIVCGVPDVLGNLPILDGSNSVGQSDISVGAAAGYGIMSVWAGPPTPFGYWQNGSAGPSYVSITGLHLRHGGPLYSYTPPGGGAAVPWVGGASCVNLRSGSYIDIGGNDMDTCTNGLFTAENANSAWANITQQVTVTGNHIHASGLAGSATYHQVYFQTFYGLFQGNLVNNYLSTASGSDFKWRGVEGIFRYNYLGTGAARDFDLVENQDAAQYETFEDYLSTPGQANCNASLYCQGDTAGANIIAAYQESEQKDFIYGNEIFPSGVNQVHYASDNVGGMSDRNGVLYFYNNTMPGAAVVFDTGENGDGMNPIYQQRVDARNNIFWAINLTGTGSAMALDHYQTLILDATTNLFENGSMSITTPIIGGSYSGGSANGWQSGCDATCLWPLSSPINTHIYGLSSSNFLLAPPTPFNTTTLVPTAGSAAIGAGTALTGIPAQLPVRWQYSIATSSLLPRTDTLTIGATDEGGATPLAATPTFSPGGGNYLSAQTVTISTTTPLANIYFTTDGTTPTYPITGTTQAYSGPITVNGQETVEAIATASGYLESAVGSATYTVGIVATPTFSPGSGSYLTDQSVTIGDVTAGATIYYTTNGNAPTTGSTVYSGPITVSNPGTLEAIATASGYAQSAVGSAVYTFTVVRPTPVYVQQCTGYQQYGNTVSCTFSSASTAGDTILIALYGAVPVSVTSTYGTPTLLTSNSSSFEPLYAYALTNIAAGTYTITLNVTGNQRIGIAADEFTDVPASPIDGSANGNNPGGYVASVVSGNFNTTQASDLLWAACFTSSAMNAGTAPITWSLLPADTLGSGGFMTLEDGVAGAAGTYYGQCTSTGANEPSIVTVALLGTPPPASTPVFSPVAGTYTTTQTVTISTTTPESTIYYTTDGTTPTYPVTGTTQQYASPISVSTSQTINAIAASAEYSNSAVGSAAYTIGTPAATPIFSPIAGTYTAIQTVTISDSTPNSTIYYTINGTTPTTTSAIYSTAITVSANETLEAIATATGYSQSTVGSAAYTINLPAAVTPIFSPIAGTYTTTQTVIISDTTPGAVIYYTTNGVAPTTGSSLYSGSISVSTTQTLEAIATANGYNQSAVGSAAYTINQPQAATPTFSPVTGTFTSIQAVTISDTTPGAAIYYTTNGTAPTTNSSHYTSAITVSATETLEAIATASGYGTSATGSAAYTINIPAVGTPSFVRQCSQYTAGNGSNNTAACTLTGVNAGDTLVIGVWSADSTLNYVSSSTTPQPVNEIPSYTGASGNGNGYMYAYILPNTPAGSITITANETGYYDPVFISVIEFTNTNTSPYDASGTGYIRQYGAYDLPSSNYTTSAANDMLWSMCSGLTGANFAVGTAESSVTWTSGGTNTSPGAVFWEYGPAGAAGTYYGDCYKGGNGYNTDIISLAIKGASTPTAATPTFSPVAGTYTTIQTVTISTTTPSATIYYTTDGTMPTTGSSAYSSAITVSASGTLSAIAVASGDINSAVGSAVYTINLPAAATPGFSPVAGSYGSAQSVTISDATGGAVIYYTTNGSTPTTGSPTYSSAISVSANETIEAIATATGYSSSGTGSAAYTIAAATPGFSPVAGSYGSAQSVTISDATAGATIYYTTNGSAPTTGSPVYSVAITVSGAETVKAIAVASGYGPSAVGSVTYLTALTTPVFSPAAGSYYGRQSITISDATPGTTIYYTTNATAPTTSSTPYTGPITVAATETIEAIAAESGAPNSALATALYTIETAAALTTPAPNTSTPLTGTSVVFAWTPGNTATHFELWVGTTGLGSSNLYNSGSVTGTTETVAGLPNNGETVYVRLYFLIGLSWHETDYTYVSYGVPTQGVLTTPTPDTSTPLSGTSVAFSWTPSNIVTHYEFWLGTTGAGSSNLYNSGSVTVTTETVNGLPSNGETVYARLYTLMDGAWKYTDHTYKVSGSPTLAVLTTPAPNTSTPLSGTSVAFAWTPGNLATHFEFHLGTTEVGSSNLYNSGNVTATTETVSNLPGNGDTVYARLYSLINGAWQYTDYTYKASGTPIAAALSVPTPNTSTPLSGTSVVFAWTPGNAATQFQFRVGTTGPASSNLYNSGTVTATTETVSGLPNNDSTVYARLYALVNGAWQTTDYTYISAGVATQATLTTPTPDTSTPLSGISVAFSWTPGNSATHFEFYAGTTGVGSSNLYNSGSVTATTETVSNLPNNGQAVYVRLYSLINGAWKYTDYTYVASGSPSPATLTTPTPNTLTPLSGASVAFSWNPGNTATRFEFYVGTTGVGSSNLYNSGNVTATAETVNNLPSNGKTVYARLYWLINGAWHYADYTYVAY